MYNKYKSTYLIFSFENYAFVQEEKASRWTEISKSPLSSEDENSHALHHVMKPKEPLDAVVCSIDTEYAEVDISTDVLKLQLYDELVQSFGPDETFSEMMKLREQCNTDIANAKVPAYEELENANKDPETIEVVNGDEHFSKQKMSQLQNNPVKNGHPGENSCTKSRLNEHKESLELQPEQKVDVLLESHVPLTYRSSYHSFIIPERIHFEDKI